MLNIMPELYTLKQNLDEFELNNLACYDVDGEDVWVANDPDANEAELLAKHDEMSDAYLKLAEQAAKSNDVDLTVILDYMNAEYEAFTRAEEEMWFC